MSIELARNEDAAPGGSEGRWTSRHGDRAGGAPHPRPFALSTDRACSVELVDATGQMPGELVAWVAERAESAAAFLECLGEVRVRVVSDEDMAAAHEKHLGDPSTTDVLTFDMADGAAARTRVLDTDVLVCLDEAGRQAALRKHGVHLEILLYVVHAMLHCVGFDDRTRARARAMHEREDEVLSAIGVGVVYRAGERADDPAPDGEGAR